MNFDKIFTSNFFFNETALELFKFQSKNNLVYKNYINALNISVDKIKYIDQIPFLPIQFFKTHKIITTHLTASNFQPPIAFTSSGTTGSLTSTHFVSDVSVYEKSFITCFQKFYGSIKDYCFLALLPSYLEREGSSLVYMCNKLIQQSQHPQSGFYLNEFEKLKHTIDHLIQQNQKFILLGVTYALLDFAETVKFRHGVCNGIIMESGGMKGKRKEMLREEIHATLKKSFGVNEIHSEYGMTELLSQAYSTVNGIYNSPPWMKILIRDINDPFSRIGINKTGGINIIDLANIHSCAFIATHDLGKVYKDGSFEVLGRFDNSDLRGCNLMIE